MPGEGNTAATLDATRHRVVLDFIDEDTARAAAEVLREHSLIGQENAEYQEHAL